MATFGDFWQIGMVLNLVHGMEFQTPLLIYFVIKMKYYSGTLFFWYHFYDPCWRQSAAKVTPKWCQNRQKIILVLKKNRGLLILLVYAMFWPLLPPRMRPQWRQKRLQKMT